MACPLVGPIGKSDPGGATLRSMSPIHPALFVQALSRVQAGESVGSLVFKAVPAQHFDGRHFQTVLFSETEARITRRDTAERVVWVDQLAEKCCRRKIRKAAEVYREDGGREECQQENN